MITLYKVLFLIHVLTAVAALGPHFGTAMMLNHMQRNPQSIPALLPVVDRLAKLPKHGSMLMLLTGVLMVWLNPAGWALFKEPWLALSLALWIFMVLFGRVMVEPLALQAARLVARDPEQTHEAAALIRKVSQRSAVLSLSILLITILMVWKP